MIRKILVPLTLFIAINSFSQSIYMEFPAFAGKTYDFIIFQGSKQETVMQDAIPANGKFTLTIPKQYAPYTGMCRWLITNTADGGGLDMAIQGYDFEVSCLSDKPDNDNIIYKGFDAVNELNRLNAMQQAIIDKFETMSRAAQLYDKKNKLNKVFAQEAALQVKEFDAFQEDLKQNTNFNARFLPIVNLTKGIPHHLTDDYNQKALLVNEFITQKMNVEDFYVSGHWQGIIQSWVLLQINVMNDKTQFAQDFKQISDRMSNPVHYTDFVGKVTYYLTQYGKDDYVEAIAHTVLSSGKISNYVGSMEVYLKAMVGMKAPDLRITETIGTESEQKPNTIVPSASLDSKYSIVLFYQAGCGYCETALEGLKANYKVLIAHGFKIISIAGDTDQETYNATAKSFPWSAKYQEVAGMNGINFKNYAVIGTPTLFLLDSKGIIIQKPATVKELIEWMEKS
jgi:peroxiredoxin